MECPKCKGVRLEKTDPSKPLWCPECGGVWVPMQDMDNVSQSFSEDLNTSMFDASAYDQKTGLCPQGHGIMLRAKVEGDKPFYLERCPHCGGIWFDHGEWQQVVKYHLTDHLADFWTTAWQRQLQSRKDRESFIELNKSLLGEDIVGDIFKLAEKLKSHPEKSRALALLRQELN